MKPKKVYCRGCNREFEVADTSSEHYIEAKENGERHWHPKKDCDER